ncbi:SDR family oxidoreductase [uncultured Paracoccus sp.]|uniref:SDR family oxidoreductase n=1 Tax=uncultured Paracoccus sp. TaxID=189685 RepID=UPI00260F6C54|nr:SDR family oxidoreductase [uncultured Paracoccus sp.]
MKLLITGGTRGIGLATAVGAARRGWEVALGYRGNEDAARLAVEQVATEGPRPAAFGADVGDAGQVAALFDAAVAHLGGLDGVVVNAGIVAQASTLADMTPDRLDRVVRTNVTGALYVAREAVRRLQPGGAIVFVSSAAARLGSPGEYVDYAATKGALDTLTVGLSKELGPTGIRVNAVRPGVIETDIHADGGEPDRAARVGPATPMGRAGRPEEVAAAILWLLSSEASYVTGAHLDIAGGR